MRLKLGLTAALSAALGAAAVLAIPRQDPGAAQDEMMARWMQYMTPGEAHQALAPRVGKWDMTVRMFMSPDAPADESKATSEMKWILGGRYLADETKGLVGGMEFEGHGLTGYDNFQQVYVGSWIDNMSTGIMHQEGRYAADTKTFTFVGEGPDFATNKMARTRTVETWIDADHWKMEMFSPGPEGEYKSMEIDYARAK